MAKGKLATNGSLVREMFQLGIYKRSQGRVARQVTFIVMAVTCGLAAFQIHNLMRTSSLAYYQYLFPGVLISVGLFISYRIVNMPRFADFLIAVEAEMNKVSWPSRPELIRSSLVVIFVIFFLALVLFGYDIIWRWVFESLGIIKGKGSN